MISIDFVYAKIADFELSDLTDEEVGMRNCGLMMMMMMWVVK